MGLINPHAVGRNRRFFVEPEGTAGTFVKATSDGAVKVLTSQMDVQIERRNRSDSRPTRSLLERMTGKGTVAWNIEKYLMPSGTAGTPPDDHQFMFAALGTYVNDAGVSDTYSPDDGQILRTLSLTHHFNDVVMESIWGAWVNAMTIKVTGGEEPKISYEGGAMGHVVTGASTLDAAMSGTPTMLVQAADGRNFAQNSIVKVGSEDNSSAGFQVTVDTSRPSFTLGDSVTSQLDDAVVTPFSPSETVAGSPISSVIGSLALDATEYPITGFDVTVAGNNKPFDDEAFQQFTDDIMPGFRDVTGNFSFRARKDHIIELGKRRAFGTRDIATVLGSTAGAICTINLNQVEFNFAAAEFPEAEEGIISIPFTALGSGAGGNEIDIAFT